LGNFLFLLGLKVLNHEVWRVAMCGKIFIKISWVLTLSRLRE